MRSLAVLLLLALGTLPGFGQWQVFAEKLPKPGTWAPSRMQTFRE